MKTTARILLASLVALSACCPAPPAPCTAADSAPPDAPAKDLRLHASDTLLYITARPKSYPRGTLLYVLDERPLHAQTHVAIGLVQVVEPTPMKVAWYCAPRKRVDSILAGPGLPVKPVEPDTKLRAGKCLGDYDGQDGASFTSDPTVPIDLPLRLGKGDGVRPGDLFEVLGEPIADEDNRVVVDFKQLARCIVQPNGLAELTSICRLSRQTWPELGRDAWTRGGLVRLIQEAP
jgi:hypothetical protein